VVCVEAVYHASLATEINDVARIAALENVMLVLPAVSVCEITRLPLSLAEGISTQDEPSDTKVSPAFADCPAYVPSVITIYTKPSLELEAVGRVLIVPPVPRVPLKTIGSGSASIRSLAVLAFLRAANDID
jgi:hypothetical protein